MRVEIHVSEQICKLCQKDYAIDLLGEGNNDVNPVEQSGNGQCIICKNETNDFVGSHVITSDPITYLEDIKIIYRDVQTLHLKRMNELLLRYRKAKLAGETHISIKEKD